MWQRIVTVRSDQRYLIIVYKFYSEKTEYLCMGEQEPERELKMQGLKHNRIQEFKYLGSTVQSDGASNKEVGKRIQAGWIA